MIDVGFLLPSRDAAVAGVDDPSRLIELAERLGFDSVWAGDSPLARPRADALMLLAAVAARTVRVRPRPPAHLVASALFDLRCV